MRFPALNELATSRQVIDVFSGYNHNLRIQDGEFYDMQNLSSECYPVLSPRKGRTTYATPSNVQGIITKDALCYVDGTNFVINKYRIDMSLSVKEEDCPKTLVSMGAYVIIMPDKKWVKTLLKDNEDPQWGSIEETFTSKSDVTFEMCNISGDLYTGATASPDEPTDPANMQLWIDTSSTPHTLKQYSKSSSMWVSIATTYVKISCVGIGKSFSKFDGVTISGIEKAVAADLNGSTVIWEKSDEDGNEFIVVIGVLDEKVTQTVAEGAITIERRMPNLDYVTEAGNRLWGCKYGFAANGEVVNEIYASKLGDFKNWNCFMGISTDSWVGSVGTDGPFTGAITHLGYPVFFKENCLHKVYISSTGAHQIQDTACRGVQKKCDKSLAIVNGVLLYKSNKAVCAYDGSLPVEVSAALGDVQYKDAAAGGTGNYYYISMKDDSNVSHMFCYDTAKGIWYKEDNTQADEFAACDDQLYYIDHADGHIKTVSGGDDNVEWWAETGLIGITLPDQKYISRLLIRMSMNMGATLKIHANYDSSGFWEPVGEIAGTSTRSFLIPIRTKRCDHMQLLFEGTGGTKIYSITKTIEQGSDVP